jgi:NitT/TauT family transport system substrate-binding protein
MRLRMSWPTVPTLVMAVALFSGTGIAEAATALRVAYIPVVTWLPAWVAKEQGFFERAGLDVSLTAAQNLSTLPGTLGRQFDIVPTTPPDLLKAAASGLDVVAVTGELFESETNKTTLVLAGKDSGVTSAKDLAGKVIATPTIGGVIHVATLYWLKINGVDPTSVRAIEVPFATMPDLLKAKRVDAVESVEPFVANLKSAGHIVMTDPLLAAKPEVLFTCWMAQGAWARSNGETLKAWTAALVDAQAFMKANPDETRKIMAKYTRLPEALVLATPIPTYKFDIKAADIEVWTDVMRAIGQFDGTVDSSKLVVTAK